MHFRISLIILAVISFILSSCTAEHSKMVVAEYGKDQITMGEFEEVYAKNVGGLETAKKDSVEKLKNFLELYTNFKMKIRDAKVRGFDQNPALLAELNDYKEKVGVSYLLEKEVIEPGTKKLYDQRKYELRVSHLMIKPDSSDEKVKAFAYSLIDSINHGAKFEDLVKKYSADQYSKNSGGDIYYITAGTVIPEFEEAAYNTEVGQINPNPVKTVYGYHILKVTEKKERIHSVQVSVILIDFKNDSSKVDSAEALAKIQEIKSKLDGGADFAELAGEYSEDPASKVKGGDIGFIQRRAMLKEIDEAAFNLKKDQYSNIIKTQYGYFILKVTNIKEYGTYESEKEDVKTTFRKTRYDATYAGFINKLKDKYRFTINNNTLDYISHKCDSTKVDEYLASYWRDGIKDSAAYLYAGKPFIVDSLFTRMEKQNEFKNKRIDLALINKAISKESENSVLAEEAANLEESDSQFASLMKDYRNGIFIFKLQDDEIWSKVEIDSAKLHDFYLMNKEKYVWADRLNYSEIYSAKDSLINHYFDLLSNGGNFDSLAAKYTERAGYKVKAGSYGLVEINNFLSKEADKLQPGQYSKPFKNGAGYSIVKLISKEPSRIKTFEEAKAEVSGQFQDFESKRLESEYISGLKQRYNPVLHYDKLEEAFKSN